MLKLHSEPMARLPHALVSPVGDTLLHVPRLRYLPNHDAFSGPMLLNDLTVVPQDLFKRKTLSYFDNREQTLLLMLLRTRKHEVKALIIS